MDRSRTWRAVSSIREKSPGCSDAVDAVDAVEMVETRSELENRSITVDIELPVSSDVLPCVEPHCDLASTYTIASGGGS